jgi:hypothetical protein
MFRRQRTSVPTPEPAMSRFLVLSLVAASLSTIVGCGASSPQAVAPTRDESSWMPAEQVAVSFSEAEAKAVEERAKTSSFRPNRQDRPVRGAIHAAIR